MWLAYPTQCSVFDSAGVFVALIVELPFVNAITFLQAWCSCSKYLEINQKCNSKITVLFSCLYKYPFFKNNWKNSLAFCQQYLNEVVCIYDLRLFPCTEGNIYPAKKLDGFLCIFVHAIWIPIKGLRNSYEEEKDFHVFSSFQFSTTSKTIEQPAFVNSPMKIESIYSIESNLEKNTKERWNILQFPSPSHICIWINTKW